MEPRYLIDRKEIFDLLDEDYGYWECVRMLINKHDLDEYEDAVLRVADDIRETIEDIVESMPVVEKREITTCICSTQTEDTYDRLYEVYYYTCGNCFESVKTENDEENFKFCPYCGAKYEKIVRH